MIRIYVCISTVAMVLALLVLLSGSVRGDGLTLALEGGGEGGLVFGLFQNSFSVEYRLSLTSTNLSGVEFGLRPPLPPIRRLGLEFEPYLMLDPARGLTAGLVGERMELSMLALFTALADLAFSTRGVMFFLKGEYVVGNIGLRGHLQLDWGELAVQPWTGKDQHSSPYFPEWALLTASGRSGYLPGSSLYMEIRRRFSKDLILAEGFTTPLGGSRIVPGLLFNMELGSFALRFLHQFPQGVEESHTLVSLGFRQGVLYTPEQQRAAIVRLDLNLRLFSTRMEVDLLSSYSTPEFDIESESHLTAEGLSYKFKFRWSF